MLTEDDKVELIQKAYLASNNAYAPYSSFKVGACALYSSGKTYSGCNVENASYGLSLCAERNAISGAISQGEKSNLIAIAIVSQNTKNCFPCGACRQWLSEFQSDNDVYIILDAGNNIYKTFTINELLPYSFNLKN